MLYCIKFTITETITNDRLQTPKRTSNSILSEG